jgi:hypothetical protein
MNPKWGKNKHQHMRFELPHFSRTAFDRLDLKAKTAGAFQGS